MRGVRDANVRATSCSRSRSDSRAQGDVAACPARAARSECGSIGWCPGGKIVLLDQQGALARARTVARDGDPHDAAANDGDLKVLPRKWDALGAG